MDVSATDYAPVSPVDRLGPTNVSTALADLGVAAFFPHVPDATTDLYMLWSDCGIGSDPARGPTIDGFNVEFIPASRQLLIHCYGGRPYVMSKPRLEGIAPAPRMHLLVISTASIGAGSITIVEQAQLERWFGDASEGTFVIGTATIS